MPKTEFAGAPMARTDNDTSQARIAIIGAGHVGATAAYALMLRALVSEIVLIDSNAELAAAEAADIADANALARPARIWAGTYADAASARIAVLTAGAATHGAESRLSVLARSALIVRECVSSLRAAGFAGIVVVAANPVDVMAQVAFRQSGLAARQVIGTGTLLDSSRLRQVLATSLALAPAAVDGLILGEHGDSEVAAFSTVRVGGLTLDEFTAPGAATDKDAIAQQAREAGYKIVSRKGYTSFAGLAAFSAHRSAKRRRAFRSGCLAVRSRSAGCSARWRADRILVRRARARLPLRSACRARPLPLPRGLGRARTHATVSRS
jgi:L-lactate dehydrogenase